MDSAEFLGNGKVFGSCIAMRFMLFLKATAPGIHRFSNCKMSFREVVRCPGLSGSEFDRRGSMEK